MYGSESWGRFPKSNQRILSASALTSTPIPETASTILPFGQGRSYGDVCLNAGGTVLTTKHCNNILAFDRERGLIRVQAGITLEDLLTVIVPAGWFIPVSPGTQYVSVGGAIANDIHGKNHHCAGTFGRHVRKMLVQRFDGEEIICSPDIDHLFFNATIAGIGLTGLIIWAEVQLIPIHNAFIETENIPFASLDEFFELSKSSEKEYAYTVSWLDCVSSGTSFGRGVFMRGNHARAGVSKPKSVDLPIRPIVPFDFPSIALNYYSVKSFNTLYHYTQSRKNGVHTVAYRPFFYPLDSVLHWNRIYGSSGFLQFQCVVGKERGKEALRAILQTTVASGQASFLAVLKEFGDIESPGLLSFPRPGYTLCLDFPYRGSKTEHLMQQLEDLVVDSDGALYPAKDACMRPETFMKCYPGLDAFKKFKDPRASSSFWRRVCGDTEQ